MLCYAMHSIHFQAGFKYHVIRMVIGKKKKSNMWGCLSKKKN